MGSWISVKQCLPRDCDQVLAFGILEGETDRSANEAFWSDDDKQWHAARWNNDRGDDAGTMKLVEVTHWMPMPLGPGA